MYKPFEVGALFDIHPTSAYKMKNGELYSTKGTTPVMSNSAVNNGIGGYCGLPPLEDGGIITFSDTTTGADTMFYQAEPFIGYPHVQGMYPYAPEKWDEKSCLYAITAIRKAAGDKWNYSVKFNRTLVKALQIELPVIESPDSEHTYTVNDIDWQYMQDRITTLAKECIEDLEQSRETELEAYLKATGLDDYELTESDKETLQMNERVSFKSFALEELFVASTGDVDLQQRDVNGKGHIFINSGIENRGIKGKTDRPARVFPANTITIDFWGNAYYRDFEYKMATHNHVFSLAGEVIKDKYTGQYIVGKLSKLPLLFSYNNMATWNKLKTLEITLPVTQAGDIDHAYMERYIRAIEKLVIDDAVQQKDKVIETTKQVAAQLAS